MRRVLLVSLASTALAMAHAVAVPTELRAQGAAATQGISEIRANGTETVSVEPDLALVTIQFTATGKTPAAAGRLAARRAAAIRAAIVALGIPSDSIPTSGAWGRWGNRSHIQVRNDLRDTSYVTNDAMTVRIRDFALIGRVIDTAMAEGAQTVSNVEFQATNTRRAELDALRKATEQARARAEAVAMAAGLRLGRVVELGIDTPGGMLATSYGMADAMALRSERIATQVVAPELKVSVVVSGRWELVAAGR